MARPIYLVTRTGNAKRRYKASRYTEMTDSGDMWVAHLMHGYYTGVSMDFWFEDEASAGVFSRWTLYDPGMILNVIGPTRQFAVKEILRWKASGPANRYTDKPTVIDAWLVRMDGQDDNGLDLTFPVERDARRFAEGRAYTLQDILGTVPSIPTDVARQLAEYAAAKRAIEEKKRQDEETKNAPPSSPAPVQTPTTGPTPTPVAPTPPTTETPPVSSGQQPEFWYITAGNSSAGYYNGAYYQTGAFLYVGPGGGGQTAYSYQGAPSYFIVTLITPPYSSTGTVDIGGETLAYTDSLQYPPTNIGRQQAYFEWYGVFTPN